MANNQKSIQTQILELRKQLEQMKDTASSFSFDTYQTSLTTQYSSAEMSQLFSQRSRHSTWRKLWLYLAESERELGIESITPEALEQMRRHLEVSDADFEVARVQEMKRRHDVMAHVHAYGAVAPAAAGIIHYGATSCYVTDNTDLILMRDAIDLLLPKLAKVIWNLAKFAVEWKWEPALAYTHLQPSSYSRVLCLADSNFPIAQLVTVGKRAAQWAQDLMFDLESIEHVRNGLKFRGAQGSTGTQASFLEIFEGDVSMCDKLNELLCKKAGFSDCYDVSTQTYTRKVDLIIANAVAGLGATAQKICGDIRRLAAWKEVEEPFEKDQIGSSRMVYKRNPMRFERIYNLSRELISKPANFANTLSEQWIERTLDDSSIRLFDIPEMFLLADAILIGLDNISSGLVVYPERIEARVQEELPFLITESIIMKLVAKGKSRQEAHEQIRVLSHPAGSAVKNEGKLNDLITRVRTTNFFRPIWDELDDMLRPELYIGRSVEIVERFCAEGGVLDEKIKPYRAFIEKSTTNV